jgi:RecA/RadA recombinase
MTELSTQFAAMQALLDVNKILDEKAHDQGLTFTTMDPSLRVKSGLSTGIYSFDLIVGGGLAPGRFSYLYGDTGSAKSTTLYHCLLSALNNSIISVFNDHESSVDPTYLGKIGIDLDDVCGQRDKKGKWIITPKLRYSVGTTAEATFKFMNQTMKALPDKIQMWDSKSEEFRYFLIHPEYKYKPTWMHINKGLKDGQIIELGDFSPQMVFITDSLKSMLPEAKDLDIDSDPIAMQARCFSQNFPLVKSLIGSKNCIYLATNHLNLNPMTKFGNPETESGGKAVQFYPDLKLKMHVNRAQSKIIEEPHASGEGIDRYIMGKTTVIKNKSGPCFRSSDFRIWIDEQGFPGRGIDPVFDIFNFLQMCGLIDTLSKQSYGIKLPSWETDKFSWKEFKEMVLVREKGAMLKAQIEELLREGKAQELYYQTLALSKGKATPVEAVMADDEKEVETIEI